MRALWSQIQHLGRFPDIQAREERFLQTEDHELDALDDVVALCECLLDGGRDGAVEEDGGWYLHYDRVGYNQVQDCAQDARLVEDEVQARPEHDRVPCYHAVPPDQHDGDGDVCGDINKKEQDEA